MRNCYVVKINKIYKPLTRLVKKQNKKKKTVQEHKLPISEMKGQLSLQVVQAHIRLETIMNNVLPTTSTP